MRPLLLLVLAVTGCVAPAVAPDPNGDPAARAVPPGEYDTSGDFSRVLRAGPHDRLPDEVETLASEVDGVDIRIGVVRPNAPEPVPVIVLASIYFLRDLAEGPLADSAGTNSRFLVENFVPHGYAVAFVSARGRGGGSGGCYEDRSPSEASDLDQAITWLATQPWSSGDVGMWGLSYDGGTAWEVASLGNPHLGTVVVASGVIDRYGSEYRNGTSLLLPLPLHLALTNWLLGAAASDPATLADPEAQQARASQLARQACPNTLDAAEASAHIYAYGTRPEYYVVRDYRAPVVESYRGSVLLIQGLRDRSLPPHTYFPWIHELEAQGVEVKLMLGLWGHTFPDRTNEVAQRWDWAEKLLEWFDAELKHDASADKGPRVEVQDTSGKWRVEDAWPPERAIPLAWWLATDAALVREPGDGTGSALLLPEASWWVGNGTGPIEIEVCRTCARFETEPLAADLRFAGLPTFHATVTPRTDQGVLLAQLVAIDGSGETLLTSARMNLRYAEGGETPHDIAPGEPIVARMEFEPTDALVPAGARLALVVGQGGSWSDRETGPLLLVSGQGHAPLVTGPIELEVGGERSALTVRAFDAELAGFFEPPRKVEP